MYIYIFIYQYDAYIDIYIYLNPKNVLDEELQTIDLLVNHSKLNSVNVSDLFIYPVFSERDD